MTRFYFIRHGDAYDENGVQEEHYSLNENGRIQAMQLAMRLKDAKFDALYCSKIQRAIETCAAVNRYHRMEVNYWPELNEVGSTEWFLHNLPDRKFREQDIKDFEVTSRNIIKYFRKLVKSARDNKFSQVAVFGHGNWIRILIGHIVSEPSLKLFNGLEIYNTSLNIVDLEDTGIIRVSSISDSAHTQIFNNVTV